jgi:hypothetical protein
VVFFSPPVSMLLLGANIGCVLDVAAKRSLAGLPAVSACPLVAPTEWDFVPSRMNMSTRNCLSFLHIPLPSICIQLAFNSPRTA